MSQPRFWIAAVVVAAAVTPSPVRADRKNEIREVTFDEDAGTTRVHVQGAQTPTFTVYKLERPSRVVIDVPQARLGEALRGHEGAAVLPANTWAISTIAAQELDDGGLVVRVIVTLARPGRYDVKTVGNDLVVMVMPRDPAPKVVSPEALAAAQAEREQARQAAQAAERGRAQAEKSSTVAMAEAAKAKDTAVAAQAETMKAKDTAAAAQAEATKTRQDAAREIEAAARTKTEAAAAKLAASREAEAARRAAAAANQDVARSKAEAENAKQDVARSKAEAETAKQDAARNRALAEATQAAAQQQLDAATRAKAEAEAARREAQAAKAEAARTQAAALAAKDDVARTKAEAAAAKAEAARTQVAVLAAKDDVARTKAEAAAARSEAARASALARASRAEAEAAKAETTQRKAEAEAAKADAAQKAAELLAARQKAEVAERDAVQKRAEATAAQADAAKLLDDNARMHADASRVRGEAEAAKAEAARMRGEAEAARKEAEAAQGQAAHEKLAAEAARSDAERLLREAKQQVAALDKKAQAAQALEDKARAANAAAQAREEAAGAIAARAAGERAAAEAAAQAAAEARERSIVQAGHQADHQAVADRDKAISDARAAEARLAQARQATETAEQQRAAAEAAAAAARHELEATRTALASVEQQRTAAEAAANQAARQRGEAEVAADEAAHRRGAAEAAATAAAKQRAAAELAASQATQRKSEAEAERTAAEQRRAAAEARARTAKAAADAAEHQRVIAEAAANAAVAAKHDAEGGLAELSAKRLAAERAATELETRSKAEAKAQAEIVAAKARQASSDELAQARAEASRLAGERQHAEAELADRRKAAFAQKAEADRLRLAASQAHDAADREEARRAKLAEQRAAEEQALARIKAQKAAAELAATQPAGKPAPATASKPGVATPPSTMAVAIPPVGTSAGASSNKAGVATGPSVATAASPVAPLTLTTAINPGMTPSTMLATAVSSGGTPSVPTAQKPGVANPPAGAATSAPVAAKPAKPTPLAQVRDIAFTGDDATGRVTIALAGDATVSLGEITPAAAELIIDHAQLGPRLERKLDVSRFGGPVRAVSSFRDRRTPDRVRLIAELASPATPTFDRQAGVVRWSFAGADLAKRPVARPALARTQDVPSPVVGGFGAASTPVAQQAVSQLPPQGNRRRVYHGQTLDIHLKDAPIRDLLRLIADTGKVSIVVPDTIDARVTLDLTRVPWDQALEVILSSHQLWYRREGNLYRVAPRKELDAEDEAEAARREAALKAEAPRPQLVPLNYSSAADLAKKLEPMLSPHGKIAVDERTNQLIVTDVSGNREQIARLALSLDTQTPQISIEARIVEANSTFLRQIGVQWGGRALAGANGGNATGLVWPSSISVIGGNVDAQTVSTGVASPSDFAVNLPAATGSGECGALGLSLGSVGGNFNINLRLSALEDAGSVRIISSPKVTVLNNKLASIASGVSIPISTVSATGTQTQFVQADLRLDVTPTVSQSDCAISMNLSVSKNAPDFGQLGARGDPTIQRREARTSMLVADGETSVLGGIYTRTTSLAYRKIPFLGDLPVLGWLFKNRREQDDRTELLVFITPKITNRALLRCGK